MIGAPVSAEPATTLPALIDLYLNWRGGPAFATLQSVHTKGPESEIWLDRSGHWRAEFNFGGVRRIRARGPDLSWSVNPSGQVEDDDPRGPVKALRRALVEFGAALGGEGGAQVQMLNPMRRPALGETEARDWAVIGIKFGDADIYGLLIDPLTGRLGGAIYEENGQTFVTDYGDWRMVGEVRMPFRVSEGGDGDRRDLHVDSVELNRPAAAALFQRPPSPRAAWKGGADSSGWIDFTLNGAQIRLPVRVNGHEAEAVLDNGAQSTLVDRRFADGIGLETIGTAALMHGVGPGEEAAGWRRGVAIQVGALTIPDLTVVSMDLSEVAHMSGEPVPLLLGDEAFAELAVDIDFARHRLRFDRPDKAEIPAGAVELPVRRNNGNDTIPVSIEDHPPAQCVVDLGSSDTIELFPDYVRAEKLLEGRATSQSLFGGIGGIQTQTDAILRKVSLGGVTLSDVPAAFLPQRVRATYSSDVQGGLGVELLHDFQLLFDYPHHRLFLAPDPQAVAQPFPRNRLGVSWLPEERGIKILLVASGSPAAKAGLKAGDVIAKIDGKPATGAQDAGSRLALKQGAAGTKIAFTLTGGEVRTVTLADYY